MVQTIKQRISLDGAEDIKRQLRDMGSAGEQAAQAIDRAIREASGGTTGFGAALGAAIERMASTEGSAEQLREAFNGLVATAGAFGGEVVNVVSILGRFATGATGAVAAVGAVTLGLAALSKEGAEAADQLALSAQQVGTTAQRYSGLGFAITQAGGTAEGFQRAMQKILEASGNAQDGASNVADASKKVGEANKGMADSSASLAEIMRKYNNQIYEQTRTSRLNLAEEVRRINLQAANENIKGTRDETGALVVSLGDRAAAEAKYQDQVYEATRSANLRLAEENRRQNLELQEQLRQRYLREMDDIRKHNAEIEAEADKALRGASAAAAKFADLGVNVFGPGGKPRDPTEVYKDLADAISKIEDPTERAAKAIELFSRRIGPQLVESLSLGRAGIDQLIDRAVKLGIVMTDAEARVGKDFVDALDAMNTAIQRVFQRIGLAFAPEFQKIVEAATDLVGDVQGGIVSGFRDFAKYLSPLFDDIANLIRGDTDKINSYFIQAISYGLKAFGEAVKLAGQAVAAFGKIVDSSLSNIAGLINDIFGTHVATYDIPAFAAAIYVAVKSVTALSGAFTLLNIAGGPWLKIILAIGVALAGLITYIDQNRQDFGALGDAVHSAIANTTQFIQQLSDELLRLANYVSGTETDSWLSWANKAVGAIADVIKYLQELGAEWGREAAARDAAQARQKAAAEQGFQPIGEGQTADFPIPFARGGTVHGPGGIDRVPAWLTAGEFVVREPVARRFRGMLERMNASVAPGFQFGGLVPSSARHFAGGGSVTGGGAMGRVAIDLTLNGHAFPDLQTDARTAASLVRFARGQRVRSAGVKPSFVGG